MAQDGAPKKKKNSKRRPGSNVLAFLMGCGLIMFGITTFRLGHYPTINITDYQVVATSSLVFGAVLLLWVVSHWTEWIGGETVNMVVGIIAALITIAAFAKQLFDTAP